MADRVTAPDVRARKGGSPLAMVTAYDTPSARIADRAGADIILVGDSVANNVLGHESTLAIGMDEMAHHVAAAARAHPRALLVADMPWLSYHLGIEDAVRNAARFIKVGAAAVKLEGGRKRVPAIEAIVGAEIPVMGHLGLTPQSVNAMGGMRVQAKADDDAQRLLDDARALTDAGVFAIVLEGIPTDVAQRVTAAVAVPTIGIGAGPDCDGQVLVYHDVLGLGEGRSPKFVRRYASLGDEAVAALERFFADVRSRAYPSDAESYHRKT